MELVLIKDQYFKEYDKRVSGIGLKHNNKFISILELHIDNNKSYGEYFPELNSHGSITMNQNVSYNKKDSNFTILYLQLDGSISNNIQEESTNNIADIRLLHNASGNFRDFTVGTKDWREISKLEKHNRSLYEIFYYL